MEKYINEYLEYLRVERRCSHKTLESYGSDIRQFIKVADVGGLEEVTKQKIRTFLYELEKDGKEATTSNRKLTAIRSFCRYLLGENYIKENPAVEIKSAKVESKLPEPLTIKKTLDIVGSAKTPKSKVVLNLLYGTGCRVEELAWIKLSDFDLEAKRIRLFGKGRKQRIVPLPDSTIKAIIEYMNSIELNGIYLFPSPSNPDTHVTTKSIYKIVKRYGNKNDVDISPHKFRHTYATHLLANGVNIRSIQKLLGHENMKTTSVYLDVVIDSIADEVIQAHPLS